MHLVTQNRRSLLSLALFGALAVVITVEGEAAAEASPPGLPVASCAIAGIAEATLTQNERDANLAPTRDAPVARRIDWRAMLPTVTRTRT